MANMMAASLSSSASLAGVAAQLRGTKAAARTTAAKPQSARADAGNTEVSFYYIPPRLTRLLRLTTR